MQEHVPFEDHHHYRRKVLCRIAKTWHGMTSLIEEACRGLNHRDRRAMMRDRFQRLVTKYSAGAGIDFSSEELPKGRMAPGSAYGDAVQA